MSLGDVNQHKAKSENETKSVIFGIVGGAFAGLAALFAISMLLKYHPGDGRDRAVEAGSSPQDIVEAKAAGVSNMELL